MHKLILTVVFFFGVFNFLFSQQHPTPAFEVLAGWPSVRDVNFSANGDEAYVSLQSLAGDVSVIACLKAKKGKWQKPVIVSFSGKYHDLEPFLSPDGLRLYFASNRPLSDSAAKPKDYDIWYVSRKSPDAEWGIPVNAGPVINSAADEFYPAITLSNNLYFTSTRTGTKGEDDIFFCEWKNGGYTQPVSLSDSVNTAGYEFNAYVAPDESYLIFSGYNRADGRGSGDLYISHRDQNNQWTKAQNLGENVNSKYMDYCPFVDQKNQVLYFTSRRAEASDADRFDTIEQLEKELNKYENGLSRIYKISDSGWLKD